MQTPNKPAHAQAHTTPAKEVNKGTVERAWQHNKTKETKRIDTAMPSKKDGKNVKKSPLNLNSPRPRQGAKEQTRQQQSRHRNGDDGVALPQHQRHTAATHRITLDTVFHFILHWSAKIVCRPALVERNGGIYYYCKISDTETLLRCVSHERCCPNNVEGVIFSLWWHVR